MSILNKFSNFQVKAADRISKEDQDFLDQHDKLYRNALEVYTRVYNIFCEEKEKNNEQMLEKYKYSSFMIPDFEIPKRIDGVQNDFVGTIYSYFNNKYHVSLTNRIPQSNIRDKCYNSSYDKKPKKLEYEIIDYNKVLDDIFDQLGGLTFTDKMIQEVKDELKNHVFHEYRDKDHWSIKIKGNVITYSDGYVVKEWYHDNYQIGSSTTSFVRKLLEAISYDYYGENYKIPGLNLLYDKYAIELSDEEMKDGLEAYNSPIERIKFFKNGRIDFKFKDAETARKFARNWLGYTLV